MHRLALGDHGVGGPARPPSSGAGACSTVSPAVGCARRRQCVSTPSFGTALTVPAARAAAPARRCPTARSRADRARASAGCRSSPYRYRASCGRRRCPCRHPAWCRRSRHRRCRAPGRPRSPVVPVALQQLELAARRDRQPLGSRSGPRLTCRSRSARWSPSWPSRSRASGVLRSRTVCSVGGPDTPGDDHAVGVSGLGEPEAGVVGRARRGERGLGQRGRGEHEKDEWR